MIFIDSNIPMYLIGAPHPNKPRAISLLEQVIRADDRMITSVEVYQELLHRYTAIDRRDAIDAAFTSLADLVDVTYPFGMPEVHRARTIIDSIPGLSARDALHIAVMERAGATRILSFDRGFDACSWIDRVY